MIKIQNLLIIIAVAISFSFAEFGKAPIGWNDFRWGLVSNGEPINNTRTKTAVEELGIKIDYRYRYVNEGVDPRKNACQNLFPWKWKANYSKDAKPKAGVEAAYVIYVLQEEGMRPGLINNIQDPEKAKLFFWTLQVVAENAAGHGSTIIVEPDTWGYFLQAANSSEGWNNLEIDPTKIPACVNNLASFQHDDSSYINPYPNEPWKEELLVTPKTISFDYLSDLPNTMSGFGVAIIRTIHKFAPDAYVGFLASHWSVNLSGWNVRGLVWSTPELVDTSAKVNIEFFSKMYGFTDTTITLKPGDRADFIGVEKNGKCAGEWTGSDLNGLWYWDDNAMENYLKWTKQIAAGLDLPVIGWQISIGNMDNPNIGDGTNFANAWKDTYFPYFFKNVDKFIDAGFIGFLVGKGLAGGTDYTLPSENVGEKGWFFNQLMEFDKGRPYCVEKDTTPPDTIPQDTTTAIKNANKKSNLFGVTAIGKSLNINLGSQGMATISVYDVSGRQILRTTTNKNAVIPLKNVNSGVYFVKTEFAGKKFVSKILLR